MTTTAHQVGPAGHAPRGSSPAERSPAHRGRSPRSDQHVVRNEFAKFRHLHVGAVAAMLVAGITGLSTVGALAGGTLSWPTVLAGLSLATGIVSPLLIAVIASRAVEVEHVGNGWLLNATAGVDRGRLTRAKFVATAIVVGAATGAAAVVVLGLGVLLGAGGLPPVGLWLGFTAAAVAVNLVVLAVQLVISTRYDNQLAALGVGVVGTVIAICATGLPGWLAHLTPWGYYALITAADYRGEQAVTLTPSYLSVAALVLVAAVAFVTHTRRLDRQEA